MKTLRVVTNGDSKSLKISQEIMAQIRVKRQWKLAEARQVLFSLVLLSKSTEPTSISCTRALRKIRLLKTKRKQKMRQI